MDCVEEVGVIEKKLRGLPGVVGFEASPVGRRLEVAYDPSLLSSQEIIKAIAEAGMKARPERPRLEETPWWRHARVKLIFASGFLTLAAFVLERLGLPHHLARFIYGAAIALGGYYPLRMALAGLRARTLNIYTLLMAAAAGAIALGFWDEAAVLVVVYTWGAVMETYAVEKARSSLKFLMELAPREALVRRNGREMALPVEEVQVGDTIIVRPGERIPLDGVIVAGSSSVDQAPITGESLPVSKEAGDTVFAGSINRRGSLEVRVTRPPSETTLAKIIHSVEKAEARKSSYQHFAERFGRIYTPAMFLLALGIALVPPLLGRPFIPWFYRSLVVLVVSCSCGLALSVPISVLAAVSNAARRGILIKGGADLEAAGSIDVVVFDKTGTLTIGMPRVTDVIPLDGSPQELLSLAAAIESRSEHPLAEAVVRRAREEGLEVPAVEEFESLTGLGARAVVGGRVYYIGSRRLCTRLGLSPDGIAETLSRLEGAGKTVVLVADRARILGVLAVADQLRPEAGEAVAELRRAGVRRLVMLTGDNEGTARAVAAQAGMDEYRAGLLPEDKVGAVRELREKYGRTAMVGDGVNDAPAMAAADIGIAMGAAGTDVALETADLALMSDDLSRIPYALRLSRRAMANIRQNVTVSLTVVALIVSLALLGKIGLVPGLLLNEGSALLVMANGLRLLR